MKVKFGTLDNIESFLQITSQLQSDVIVSNGSIVRDGKSSVGMMDISPNSVVKVEIHAKNDSEPEQFFRKLEELGIVVH